MECLVKVVIPIYQTHFTALEQAALDNTMKVLSNYPRVIVKPDYLDIHSLISSYPDAEVISVSSNWLGNINGISGYNSMMMSKEFYALFSDADYILICQPDAWIFRDELTQWCYKGYDYVAAPWPKRPIYDHFPLQQLLWIRNRFLGSRLHPLRQHMFNRVGNGGLSLRKISSFSAACDLYASEISYFKSKHHHLYNEDVFWALIPENFRYPDLTEALKFSFDVKPEFCYKLNNHQLPFVCHGITYPRIYKFWKDKLPVPNPYSA